MGNKQAAYFIFLIRTKLKPEKPEESASGARHKASGSLLESIFEHRWRPFNGQPYRLGRANFSDFDRTSPPGREQIFTSDRLSYEMVNLQTHPAGSCSLDYPLYHVWDGEEDAHLA
jgi:hypothetical protein